MKPTMADKGILKKYREIMKQEIRIRKDHQPNRAFYQNLSIVDCDEEIYGMVQQIIGVCTSSFVSRSYNLSYNLYENSFSYESVAAHTNLVSEIASLALDYSYGYGFGFDNDKWSMTADGYSYREIMETIRLHDIAENETGDLPDNGSRDEILKTRQEKIYLKNYLESFSKQNNHLKQAILNLFTEIGQKDTPTGKLVFLSDKVAALIVTLVLDSLGQPPMMLDDSPYASERDRLEMEMCDPPAKHVYKASEMWAIDFFVLRNMVNYDENFFFTAIIVMATLIVNRRWYNWRNANY